jgi:DNA-binding MarR family transcriptional regulator
MHPDRPQAPGYLANLMARLFHEVSGDGLAPLGIRPEQFPFLIELWFSETDVTHASLQRTQEMDGRGIEGTLLRLAADGLIVAVPADLNQRIVLTSRAVAVRDTAIAAARRANHAASAVLSEAEMAQFLEMMNRVVDALQAARKA